MIGLWNDESATQATGGKSTGHWSASRVEIDSRRVQLGDVFVAIKGERVDGHEYVSDALARGAVAAIVSRVPEHVPRGAALVVVEDTMEALRRMAVFARARAKARVVGITGSVGKTSTKEMLRLALLAYGKTFATTGNFNNHIGTPLNLANLPIDAEFAVFEMGMNHAGEIAQLTQMVKPEIAIITTVEAVHLEFFDSLQGIADAKAEIMLAVPKEGTVILNHDNQFFPYLSDKAKALGIADIRGFGEIAASDYRLLGYKVVHGISQVEASARGKNIHYTIGTVGKHWATSSLSVLAALDALKLHLNTGASALAEFGEVEGRGKVLAITVEGKNITVIDDSYNASPVSMRAAFAKLAEVHQAQGAKGRKLAALGDMLELGNTAPELHAALSQSLDGFDKVFTSGALMRHLHAALPAEIRATHMLDAQALLPLIVKTLQENDVLLIKGSHGSDMYKLATQLIESSHKTEKKNVV